MNYTLKSNGNADTEYQASREVNVATFEDRYGDERVIHRTRHGLKVKRTHATPVLAMNPVIGRLIGERVHHWRLERGLSQTELAQRIGIVGGHPKQRIHDIEHGTRRDAIRMGTLYALAMALNVDTSALLPTVEEVRREANILQVETPTVTLGA